MIRNQNQRLYSLNYLDISLANVQRTAKLILENLRVFEVKNQRKNVQWWRLIINDKVYVYDRSLIPLIEHLLQIRFLGRAYKGQNNGLLSSNCTQRLNGYEIVEKIRSLDNLIAVLLNIVRNECKNKSVLALKLEAGLITSTQWYRFLTQISNLNTRLQCFCLSSAIKEVKIYEQLLPEVLPDNMERDFKIVSRMILRLDRSLAGLRICAAELDFYFNVNGTGVEEVAEKNLPTWKLKYQFLTYLIDLILGIRLVGEKNPPLIRKYEWVMPEKFTKGFMQQISNRFIYWLNKFRDWVIEIDAAIVLYRISADEQYTVFFESWTRFKNAFLPLKDLIDLEMALIECRQPGWVRRYAGEIAS